ncbi:two-component regulator propeller domain-containing protein [Chitinophagaceae bacterium LWZ2-11]
MPSPFNIKFSVRLSVGFASLLFCLAASAQTSLPPIGYWQEHLSYQSTQQVIKGDKIYCSTPYNVFSVDANNEIERYSKVNGLHEIGVSTIGFDNATGQLVIAYNNSNIDVLKGGAVQQISDIKQSNITGDKTIYAMYCLNGYAYLCSGLGVIVADLTKYEIKDTWIIGNTGNQVKVNNIISAGSNFYAATNEGLKTANVNSANLSNYANWTNLSGNNGLSPGIVRNVNNIGNTITVLKNDSILILNNNNWSLLYTDPAWHIINAATSSGKLLVCQSGVGNTSRVIQLNLTGSIEQTLSQQGIISFPKQALLDNAAVWTADSINGLSKYTNNYQQYIPNGPQGIATGEMLVRNNTLYVAAGSVDDSWKSTGNINGYYSFNEGTWKNTGRYNTPQLDTVYDLISITIDPIDQSIWTGSYGNGLININNNQFKKFDKTNSSLQSAIVDPLSCRVSGLAFDANNNLWVSNYGASKDLSVRKPNGAWLSFTIPFIHTENAVSQIVVDDANQLWIVSPKGNGIFCYNYGSSVDAVNDDKWKLLQQGTGLGNLPSNNVFCAAKDKNGFIWIGTDKGVAVVQCASNFFTQNCDAVLPVVQNDNFAGYLFQDEQVKTIAVDGADRKWVGTRNGIWLISPEGDKTIYHFTQDNSPLLNNDIKRITIDPLTGEVYIATASGICSFRSTATEGAESMSNVLVFPNPVPPGYNGTIAIRGLAENSLVKICELNGRLVYQTRSLGGQAVWNGQNYKGEQIATGVYLVIVRTDDGNEKIATKIVVVK